MWSLPNIAAMNARAAAQASKLRRAMRRGPGKRQVCDVYGCGGKAFESVPWFDVFSDDPKGLIHVCTAHSAEDVEEFFVCEGCQRVMIDHITWERYAVQIGNRTLCLKCAAEEYFADPANWIEPKLVKEVGFDRNGAPLFNTEKGFLNLARCRHVLGVEQKPPAGIIFVDNFEVDSTDLHQISGDHPRDIVRQLEAPFCAVLDAGWQFAVSIGFYIRQPVENLAVAA
jgi:hypothetical protein